MTSVPLDRPKAGDAQVSAAMLQQLIRLAGIIGRVSGDGSTVSVDAESLSIVADRNMPDVFVARITEADNAGNYGWVRQHPADESSGFEDQPDGMSGSLEDDPARELNGSESVEVDSLCVMFPSWASEGGSGTTPVWRGWRFIGAKAPAQGQAVRLVTALETGEVAPTGKEWLEPAVLQQWNSTDGDWEDTDPPVYVLAYRPSKHTVGPSSDGNVPFPATFLGYFTWAVGDVSTTRAVYQIDQQVLAGGADPNGITTFTPGTRTNYVYDLSDLIFNHGFITYGSLVSNPTGLGQLEVNCLPATPNNGGIVTFFDPLTYNPTNTARLAPEYQWLGRGTKGVDQLLIGGGETEGGFGSITFGVDSGRGFGGTPADSHYIGQLSNYITQTGLASIGGGAGFVGIGNGDGQYIKIEGDELNVCDSGTKLSLFKVWAESVWWQGGVNGPAMNLQMGTNGYFRITRNGMEGESGSYRAFDAAPDGTTIRTAPGISASGFGVGVYDGPGAITRTVGVTVEPALNIIGSVFVLETGTASFDAGTSLTVSGTRYFNNGIFIGSSLPPVTGTVGVANGGTGATSFTSGAILYGNGTSPIQAAANASIVAGVFTVTDGSNTISFGVEEE